MFLPSGETVAREICEVNNFSLTHCTVPANNGCRGLSIHVARFIAGPPIDMPRVEWYEEDVA